MNDRITLKESAEGISHGVRKVLPDDPRQLIESYDFRRPDRIAKDQIRAVHLLHENFSGKLTSSLSAYLRAYVSITLISVEQLPFIEFSQCFPSPTCMASFSMRPFEGSGVLELNPSLIFPILERLLGGAGRGGTKVSRKITEIEQMILSGLFRIVLNDLKQAWHPVSSIEFALDTFETDPQVLQILTPNEAVVAISLEVRVGDMTGMMNIGIPSTVVKSLRQKFNQQSMTRRPESTQQDQSRVFRLIRSSQVSIESCLTGPTMKMKDLVDIKVDDVVVFDFPVGKLMELYVNGKRKYEGQIVSVGQKRAFQVAQSTD